MPGSTTTHSCPGPGGHGVAVRAERAGGKGADEHPCRLRGALRRPGAARGRTAPPPRLAVDQRAAAVPGPSGAAPPTHPPVRGVRHRAHEQAAAPGRAASPAAPAGAPRRAGRASAAATWASSPPSSPSLVVVGAALLITGVFQGDDDRGRRRRHADRRPARGATTNADGTVSCTYTPDDVGQPEPHRRRHAAHPRGDPDPGHQHAADEHRPGRPDADPGPGGGPVRGGQLHLPGRSRSSSTAAPATARSTSRAFGVLQCGDPTRHRLGRPDLQVRRGGHPGDHLPARHDRHGQERRPRASTGSQFFLVLRRHAAAARTTPSSARSTRPASPSWTQIAAAGNDGSFEPSPGGGAPNVPVTIETMTVVS